MSLIDGLEVVESSTLDDGCSALFLPLSTRLREMGLKGVLAIGVQIDHYYDAIAVLETGIATVSTIRPGETAGAAYARFSAEPQTFMEIASDCAGEQLFVHRFLIVADAGQLAEITSTEASTLHQVTARSTAVRFCSFDGLPEALSLLGDACNAALAATLYPLFSPEPIAALVSLVHDHQRRFGFASEHIPWLDVLPGHKPNAESPSPDKPPPDSTGTPTHSPNTRPDSEPEAEDDWLSPHSGPAPVRVDILDDESSAEKGGVAVLTPPAGASASDAPSPVIRPDPPKGIFGFIRRHGKLLGLGLVVAVAGWRILGPVLWPTQDAQVVQPIAVQLAERTEELFTGLEADGPPPVGEFSPRLADSLENEYTLGFRSLWTPGVRPTITARQSALATDGKSAQVAFGMVYADNSTHSLLVNWRKTSDSWLIDDWQVSSAPSIGNSSPELPGAKLRCRRDNNLPPPEAGLLKLYDLPTFANQSKLSEVTFRGFVSTVTTRLSDPSAIQQYFSSSFYQQLAKTGGVVGKLAVTSDTRISFGPSLWSGRPVYWFTLSYPNNPQNVSGVAAFKVESGQVTIDYLEVACRA